MPINSTRGAASAKGFGFTAGGNPYICASGGTVVTCGDFKTHIFTGPGSFVVNKSPSSPSNTGVDYFVVAGGGGAISRGAPTNVGGAGAGGFRLSNSYGLSAPTMSPLSSPSGLSVLSQSYPITVGAGGAGAGVCGPQASAKGSDSIFSTITSTGGGSNGTNQGVAGAPGGSAGGGTGTTGGGTGNSPPVSPSQGNNGGNGSDGVSQGTHGGGGGGAGVAGENAPGPSGGGGVGGDGSFIAPGFIGSTAPSYGTTGPVSSTRYFAGGGGGGSNNSASKPGGAGGGGPAEPGPAPSHNATINTGGGSGGNAGGGDGGSGIVMIRYRYK
jgi:hypothetical protein